MAKCKESKKVAYLGPEGSFCEEAAKKHFSEGMLVPCTSVASIFVAVESAEVDCGVVPVENSTEGSVSSTLDCLLESKVMVCGEVELKVIQNLIVKPGMKLDEIKVILSHPHALAQCRQFIEKTFPHAELKETSSTSKAVELLGCVSNAAAIGTETAALKSRMTVLKRGIEDSHNNFTRFFVLAEKDSEPTGRDKTSLIFSTKHMPGSLYDVLEVFATRNVNLTKIESRPQKEMPWNYLFYLDFEGHRTDLKMVKALEEMRDRCDFIKVLGSYPRVA